MNKKYYLLFALFISVISVFAQKKDENEIKKMTADFEANKTKLELPLINSKVDFKTLKNDTIYKENKPKYIIKTSIGYFGYPTELIIKDIETTDFVNAAVDTVIEQSKQIYGRRAFDSFLETGKDSFNKPGSFH
jgi:hypothetical protein